MSIPSDNPDPSKEFLKYVTNLNSMLEEEKATKEKYMKPGKRETHVKLEFRLPVLQAMILLKLITEMENKDGP